MAEHSLEAVKAEMLRDELQAADQQRDRLLEATQKVRETASRSIPDHVAALEGLYETAAAIESEVGK